MGVIIINSYVLGNPPLTLSITNPADARGGIIQWGGVAGTSQISGVGDISAHATPAGGSGGYSYSWTLSELDDPTSSFSINTQGTTNAQTYDTSRITGNTPANVHAPPNDGVYRVHCQVTDSGGDTATAQADFPVQTIVI